MAKAKTVALILIRSGDVTITYHDTEDAANKAADKAAEFDDGFMIGSLADLEPALPDNEGMSLENALLTFNHLGGVENVPPESIEDADEARRWVWQLLLGNMPDHPDYDAMFGAEAAQAHNDTTDADDLPKPEEEN